MEIPNKLKKLYRHWDFHTNLKIYPKKDIVDIFKTKKLDKEVSWFIHERMNIWKQKTAGDKLPYTKDDFLCRYRFTNILREFDRQTIEFHTLLNPIRDNFPLWLLNMFYYRMVARTETVVNVGRLSFNKKRNRELYNRLMKSPRPRYGTPYVFPVSVIQKSSTPTRELFITEYLPDIIEAVANEITTWNKKSVYDGLEAVISIFGYNLFFLWTEVLIDVAYQYPGYIDLFGRFPIGPGSLPTIKRIDESKDPTILVQELSSVRLDIDLTYNGSSIQLSAENWEGIGCEFRKYTNLKAGRGRKRLFNQ